MMEERATKRRQPIESFRDLEVYQRAQRCMSEVHKLVLTFPEHERYGLVDQMCRASKSIGALIAEGWGLRHSEREFKNYLRRSLGSANEMESHLDTAKQLGYAVEAATERLIAEYRALGGQLVQLTRKCKTYDRPSSMIHHPSSPRKR
jgi:four helix bundle protein